MHRFFVIQAGIFEDAPRPLAFRGLIFGTLNDQAARRAAHGRQLALRFMRGGNKTEVNVDCLTGLLCRSIRVRWRFVLGLCLWTVPKISIDQDTPNRIRTDNLHPVVGFGQLIGNAKLAPIGVLTSQVNHLLFDLECRPVGILGRMALEVLQCFIAIAFEARFPIVKGALPNVSFTTARSTPPVSSQTWNRSLRCCAVVRG